MANYDFIEGKKRVEAILTSTNETQELSTIPVESAFSYGNGYYGFVSAIFVDICESSKWFFDSSIRKTSKAKVIRSFTSEVIEVLRSGNNLRDIGIRGDCVFAIYTTPNQEDDYELFDKAAYINTLSKMLNGLFRKRGFNTIRYGIGIATGNVLTVKAGRVGSGINDLVWIGEAVALASKFSNLANRDGLSPILVSEEFLDSLKAAIKKSNPNNLKLEWFALFSRKGYKGLQCDIVKTEMNEWINQGMPNE